MRYLIIILFILSTSCASFDEVRRIDWQENTIVLKLSEMDMTTSNYWKVYFIKHGSSNEKLIFESYGSPYITDVSVQTNNLIIDCLTSDNSDHQIELDLNNLDDYLDNPVKYETYVLKQTNDSYKEPLFITVERKIAIKNGLIEYY